jgi:hypothetical protein
MQPSPNASLKRDTSAMLRLETAAMLWGFLFLALAAYSIKCAITAKKFKAPVVVTLAEFLKLQPTEGWYTIKNVRLDMAHTVNWEENNVTIEVNAPLMGLPKSAPQIFATLKDPKVLSAYIDHGYAQRKGPAEAQAFMAQHADVFRAQQRDISGLVSVGKRDPMGEWQKAGVEPATVVCIEDGWAPNPTLAYVGILTGLGLGALCFGYVHRARARRN